MDAHSILAATAKVCRELQSLAVNIDSVHESGYAGAVDRREQRFQAYFSAPDKVRIEHSGRFGSIVVSDAVELHRYMGIPNRYWKTFECRNNHEWEGDAVVERSKLRFQGREVAFERRMTLSEDGKTLRIAERITGPQGDTEREFSVPMG